MSTLQTMKVLDVHNGPIKYSCVKHLDMSVNPYYLYKSIWMDGRWHKKLIDRFQDF